MYDNWLVKLCNHEPQEIEPVVEVMETGLDYLQEKIAEADQMGRELAYEHPELLAVEELKQTVNDLSDEDAVKIAAMMDKEALFGIGKGLNAIKNVAGRALSSGAGGKALGWAKANPMAAAGIGGAAVGGVHSKATGGSFLGGAALGGGLGYGAGRLAGGKAISGALGKVGRWGQRRAANIGAAGEGAGISASAAKKLRLQGPMRPDGKYASVTEELYKEALFGGGALKAFGGKLLGSARANPALAGAAVGAAGGALAGGEGNRMTGAMLGAGVGGAVAGSGSRLMQGMGRRGALGADEAARAAKGTAARMGQKATTQQAAQVASMPMMGRGAHNIGVPSSVAAGAPVAKMRKGLDAKAKLPSKRSMAKFQKSQAKANPGAQSLAERYPKAAIGGNTAAPVTGSMGGSAKPWQHLKAKADPSTQWDGKFASATADKEKIAMMCDAGGDGNWLTQFEGTPLLDKAIEIETQLLESEKDDLERRIQERASRPPMEANNEMWDMQDRMRLEKKMLELQLVADRNSQEVNDVYQQAGMEPEPEEPQPDPEQQNELENSVNSAEAGAIPAPGQAKVATLNPWPIILGVPGAIGAGVGAYKGVKGTEDRSTKAKLLAGLAGGVGGGALGAATGAGAGLLTGGSLNKLRLMAGGALNKRKATHPLLDKIMIPTMIGAGGAAALGGGALGGAAAGSLSGKSVKGLTKTEKEALEHKISKAKKRLKSLESEKVAYLPQVPLA